MIKCINCGRESEEESEEVNTKDSAFFLCEKCGKYLCQTCINQPIPLLINRHWICTNCEIKEKRKRVINVKTWQIMDQNKKGFIMTQKPSYSMVEYAMAIFTIAIFIIFAIIAGYYNFVLKGVVEVAFMQTFLDIATTFGIFITFLLAVYFYIAFHAKKSRLNLITCVLSVIILILGLIFLILIESFYFESMYPNSLLYLVSTIIIPIFFSIACPFGNKKEAIKKIADGVMQRRIPISSKDILFNMIETSEMDLKYWVVPEGTDKWEIIARQNFWRMYNQSKNVNIEEEQARLKTLTIDQWDQYLKEHKGVDLKMAFPRGKVWKSPSGEWRFYFNAEV